MAHLYLAGRRETATNKTKQAQVDLFETYGLQEIANNFQGEKTSSDLSTYTTHLPGNAPSPKTTPFFTLRSVFETQPIEPHEQFVFHKFDASTLKRSFVFDNSKAQLEEQERAKLEEAERKEKEKKKKKKGSKSKDLDPEARKEKKRKKKEKKDKKRKEREERSRQHGEDEHSAKRKA